MLHTMAFVALMSATLGQGDGLALTGARLTHGILGPTRADSKLLPGDSLFIAFEIEGITVDRGGKVLYATMTEVTDARGKALLRAPSQDLEAINALGGNRLPAYARVDVGPDMPAGDYTAKVTVTDRASKKSTSLTQPFSVAKPGFGIVAVTTSSDPEARVPAGLLGPGHSMFLNGAVVGFQRAQGANGQPNVTFELRVLESGKPTLAMPFTGAINKDVGPRDTAIPVQYALALNRPGQFTVEVKATDHVAKKTFTLSFPITVLGK
jgi:hypothetical protein